MKLTAEQQLQIIATIKEYGALFEIVGDQNINRVSPPALASIIVNDLSQMED